MSALPPIIFLKRDQYLENKNKNMSALPPVKVYCLKVSPSELHVKSTASVAPAESHLSYSNITSIGARHRVRLIDWSWSVGPIVRLTISIMCFRHI